MRRALAILVALSSTAKAEGDPEPEPPRVGLEIRLGAQTTKSFPAAAAYAWARVAGPFQLAAGYEVVRVYDVGLPSSCQTTIRPTVGAGLRGGGLYTRRLPHGFWARGGLLLGVGSPSLAAARLPIDAGGAVFEAALDASLGWSYRFFSASLYATPTFAVGSLSGGEKLCPPARSVDVRAFDLHFGLALAFQL